MELFPTYCVFIYKGVDVMSNGIFLICFGILTIALGIFRINKPTFGWSANESWKVKGDSEPSDTYISAVKFRGVIVIMIGSVLFLGGILNLFWIPSVHLILAACFRSSRDDVITLLPYLNAWIRSYWLVMSRANPFNPKREEKRLMSFHLLSSFLQHVSCTQNTLS